MSEDEVQLNSYKISNYLRVQLHCLVQRRFSKKFGSRHGHLLKISQHILLYPGCQESSKVVSRIFLKKKILFISLTSHNSSKFYIVNKVDS